LHNFVVELSDNVYDTTIVEKTSSDYRFIML